MKSIEITLTSIPVAKTNRYIRRRGGKVFLPPRVKHWQSRALWEVLEQFKSETIRGPVRVFVKLTLPDRRRRDIDNMLKSLWDVLERAKVIEDDSLIYEVFVKKEVKRGEKGTFIRVESLEAL